MNGKLYIENLSVSTTESELQKLFLQARTANSVWMSKDRKSGRSMGFAYLEMSNQAEAEKAIEMFSGYVLVRQAYSILMYTINITVSGLCGHDFSPHSIDKLYRA